MGKLVTIIGNIGVGKTTAARISAAELGADYYGESHDDRPFQRLAKTDPRFTFHNQVNYLLTRAEQEEQARKGTHPAIFDGGLDMDLHVFTTLFFENGSLSKIEYDELTRLGTFFRRHLPHPDLVVVLRAKDEVIQARYRARDRINLALVQDMARIDSLITEYINTIPTNTLLFYDTTNEDKDYSTFKHILGKQL